MQGGPDGRLPILVRLADFGLDVDNAAHEVEQLRAFGVPGEFQQFAIGAAAQAGEKREGEILRHCPAFVARGVGHEFASLRHREDVRLAAP